MKISIKEFIEGLLLLDSKEDEYWVKDPKRVGNKMDCFLETAFKLTISKQFPIKNGMVILKNFSKKESIFMPKNSDLRLVPRW